MHRPIRTALVALVAIPFAVAACGDDDDGGDAVEPAQTTASTLSLAQYTAAGTAICEGLGPRIAEAFPDPVGEPDVPYLRTIAGPIADVMEDGRRQFAELQPPAEAAEGHDALLSAIDDSVEQLRAVLDDDAAAEAMLEDGPPLDEPSEAAAAVGFENCG